MSDREGNVPSFGPLEGAEQVSLRVHISALRKDLEKNDPGRRSIANVSGRGNSFVVPVTTLSSHATDCLLLEEVSANTTWAGCVFVRD
jgi:DNA-binding winged helix-turn-helix (wHTH) protein